MQGHQRGVVHAVDVVAAQDQDQLGVVLIDEGDIVVEGVGAAFVPLAALQAGIRREHMDAAFQAVEVPRLAVADVGV
jgi:hypothetical protein